MDHMEIILVTLFILICVSTIYAIFCILASLVVCIIFFIRVIFYIICIPFSLIKYVISGQKEMTTEMINENTPLLLEPSMRQFRQNQNRSNQLNPNNFRYWRSRGNTTRPNAWDEVTRHRNILGHLENQANTVAYCSDTQRMKIKRDTQRVERSVKRALGGNAMVYKGGSQLKRTNVATSDNDLKIKVPQPLTMKDRERLEDELVREFGIANVDKSHAKITVVRGEGGDIDIVPDKAEYFPSDFKFDELGRNPFPCNSTARHAVRIIKMNHCHMPGIKIEKAVLQAQQQNKGISLDRLIEEGEQIIYNDTVALHCFIRDIM